MKNLQINGRKLILYGTGSFAELVLTKISQSNETAVDFCVSRDAIDGNKFRNLDVFSPDILDKTKHFVLIGSQPYCSEIREKLIAKGFRDNTDFVFWYGKTYSYYRSCDFIEQYIFYLFPIKFCCGDFGKQKSPSIACQPNENSKSLVNRYLKTKGDIINEFKHPEIPVKYSNQCLKCREMKYSFWPDNKKIHILSLALYPAPCNFNCIYCVEYDAGLIAPPPMTQRFQRR